MGGLGVDAFDRLGCERGSFFGVSNALLPLDRAAFFGNTLDTVCNSSHTSRVYFLEAVMSKTHDNLKTAFAGESQAFRKYMLYAEKAEAEGLRNIAKLFRAAADAEFVHAGKHWKALGMVRDTLTNLKDALAGETYEVDEMYPSFLAQAQKDEEITAQYAFKGALEAEKVHKELYSKAIENLQQGKDIEPFSVYTCTVCGYTHVGGPIDECPVCKAKWSAFREVK